MQIKPAPHEGDIYFTFTENGLSPFYALESLRSGYDGWKTEGKPTREIEFNGETYALALDYSESGFKPWKHPDFDIETVREYTLYIVAKDSPHYEGKPADQDDRTKGGTISVSPRWPNMKSKDGNRDPSVPDYGKPYIEARTQLSNIPHGDYHNLLKRVFDAYDISASHFQTPHPDSTINDLAYYVRPKREFSGPLHATEGPIARSHNVITGDRSGYRKHEEDNTKIPGYRVTTHIEDKKAHSLIKGHELGKEIKHYYPKDPSVWEPDQAPYHPKLEVSYQTRITDETLRYEDLEDARRELEETILNCLDWAELATSAESDVWCDFDPYWNVEDTHESRKIEPCPLPKIEDEQEHLVMSLWGDMTDSDKDVCELLLTDGGSVSPQDAAEKTNNSYRTIRSVTERLEGLIDHTYGELELSSKKIQQELKSRVRAAGDRFEQEIESATMELADASEDRARTGWDRWRREYAASIEKRDFRKIVRMGYKPGDIDEAREILKDGLLQLNQLDEDRARKMQIAGKAICELANGDRAEIDLEHHDVKIGRQGGIDLC